MNKNTMRILILGASGMLGHKLWNFLSVRFPNTYATIRGCREEYQKFNLFKSDGRVFEKIDALNFTDLENIFCKIKPQVILNCIGFTKRKKNEDSLTLSISLNTQLPYKLVAWADKNNSKVINFSTDCVFDGKIGYYKEESIPSAEDIYGKTKANGEIKEGNSLTLRSSFIGPELISNSELLEWFLSQSGVVKGYINAIYSGFTTLELCRIVEMLLVNFPEARGLYNVSSNPISKFDLLMLIKKKMNLNIEIIPDGNFICNRSLDSTKFRSEFKYIPPSWEKMIDELAIELKGRKNDV